LSDLVYGDKRIDSWVANNLGFRQWSDSYSIANVKGDFILGATVFHNWHPETGVVELTSYAESPKWMDRKMMNAVFGYAFDHLECQLVALRVSETNTRMVNIAQGLGFKGYLIPRLRGKTEAEWVFTLTDDDWLNSRYNRRPS
jgi:RimJ/RimL family protein N-acetyltransferase